MRNKENYEKYVTINDYKQTGIIENCIFNKLDDFHVTNNVGVDVMQDILEGVCQ